MIAAKRQFASAIVESDDFLELPGTAQLLYFHLNLHADNEGVVDSPRRVMKSIGATGGDMQCLIEAGYIIQLEQFRVMIVTDWFIHNTIQFDPKHSARSKHIAAVKCLARDEDGRYVLDDNRLLEASKRSIRGLCPNTTTTNENVNNNVIQQQDCEDITAIIEKYNVGKTVTLLKRGGYDENRICLSLLLLAAEGDNVQNPGAWLRCAVRDGYERTPAMEKKAAARQENIRLQEEIDEQLRQSGRRGDDDEQSGDYVIDDELSEILRKSNSNGKSRSTGR